MKVLKYFHQLKSIYTEHSFIPYPNRQKSVWRLCQLYKIFGDTKSTSGMSEQGHLTESHESWKRGWYFLIVLVWFRNPRPDVLCVMIRRTSTRSSVGQSIEKSSGVGYWDFEVEFCRISLLATGVAGYGNLNWIVDDN